MTEDQYKVVQDNLGEYNVLRPDNSIVCTELQYKATAELFCDELNELSNENEQLEQQSNSVYEIIKEYVMSHHCRSTMRMLKKIEKVMWND